MNKKIIILATVLMLSSLTACGKGGDEPVDTTQTVTTSSTTQSAESIAAQSSESKSNDASSVELPLTAGFPIAEVYIDGPSYQFIENGYTSLYNVNGNRFIALTTNMDVKVNKPSEILNALFEKFKAGVDTYSNASEPIKFNIKESKEMKINGIDFYRFQGDYVCKGGSGERNCYAVGYTFINSVDNIPCQIVGAVVSKEQSQKEIDEITTYVDAMVQTIRNKW